MKLGIRHVPYALVAAIPLLALVLALADGARLAGDRSVFALQVADVANGHFPSLGQYSWHGWNHPGPIAFYLFAPFHWILGGSAAAMFVGAAVWNAGFGVLTVRTAARRHPAAGHLVVVVLALAWISAGRLSPTDPWTPYLALPVFGWFIVGVWGTVERDRSAVWAMCISTAVLVQVHVGYVPITAVVGTIALILNWRGGGAVTQLARPIVGGLALFVPWLFHPVAVARNLADLMRFFVSDGHPSLGLSRGLRVLATEVSPEASWLGGVREAPVSGEAPASSLAWLVLFVALVVVAAWSSWRVARVRAVIPCLVAGVIMTGLAVVQVRGFVFPYVVLFRTPVLVTTLLWCLVAVAVRCRIPATASRVAVTLAVLGSVTATSIMVGSTDGVTSDVDVVDEVVSIASHAAITEPLLLRLGDGGLVGLYPELVRTFEENGVTIGIEPGTEWVYGERALDPQSAAEVWFICDTGVAMSLLSVQPGARVVAQVTPFDPSVEAELVEIQIALAEQLRTIGRPADLPILDSPLVTYALGPSALTDGELDQVLVTRLGTLNARTPKPGYRFGIVAFPADRLPDVWWSLEAFNAE